MLQAPYDYYGVEMPKLQKHLAYKYKDKDHYKHVVVIPDEVVGRLGWREGDELEPKIEGDALILKPQSEDVTKEITENTKQHPPMGEGKIEMKRREQ
jgi:bifunctional DNA-binding transcriptional regulator/antitoxin component of YhaV-PrlF toxin-antitoxin module